MGWMTTLSLRLEVKWGGGIESVARELVDIARRVGISCVVEFNSVELIAHPDDIAAEIVEYYNRTRNRI